MSRPSPPAAHSITAWPLSNLFTVHGPAGPQGGRAPRPPARGGRVARQAPDAAPPRPAAGGNAHREYVLPAPVERFGGHAIASVGLPCVGLPNLHAVEEGVVRIVDPPELEIDLRSFSRSVALVRQLEPRAIPRKAAIVREPSLVPAL